MRTLKEIGADIRAARKSAGMTQQRLGELMGFATDRAQRNVYKIEQGIEKPPYDRLRAIHDALDIPFDLLIP